MKILKTGLLILIPMITYAQFSEQKIIANCENCDPFTLFTTDLDGDGDKDLLTAFTYANKIVWYANDGQGNFSEERIIPSTTGMPVYPYSVHSVDVDLDGDMDVFVTNIGNFTISWYENDGLGNFSEERILPREIGLSFSIISMDIDGDENIDIIAASYTANQIGWYEKDSDDNLALQKIIPIDALCANHIRSGDIDGDDDMDLLVPSSCDNKIAWYANDGLGNFSAQNIISTAVDSITAAQVADLDGDGDLDVFSSSYGSNNIAWYANDGQGNFSEPNLISNEVERAHFVTSADLDLDGDIDVLSSSSRGNQLAWYENGGQGNFLEPKILSTDMLGAGYVHTEDIDGDGDMDVIYASTSGGIIAWFENLHPRTTPINTIPDNQEQFLVYPNPFKEVLFIKRQADRIQDQRQLIIFDETGKEVNSTPINSDIHQLPTNNMNRGTYFYQITNANGQAISNGKMIKN